jgi:hypothetical protein
MSARDMQSACPFPARDVREGVRHGSGGVFLPNSALPQSTDIARRSDRVRLVPNTIAPESVICLLRGNVGWIGLIEVVIDYLPGAAKVPAIHSDGDRRELRLDGCRGGAVVHLHRSHP